MRRFEIFAAGQRTDSAGATRTFSVADLAATAAAYDPAQHEAPIVIGHPAGDDPAFGWIAGLDVEGDRLLARPAQVASSFAEQVGAGAYKKVSAAFYPPDSPRNPVPGVWYLRHVGFLGAMPPAVKGLRPVEFSDCEAGDLELFEVAFAEGAADDPANRASTPDLSADPPAQEPAPQPEPIPEDTVTPQQAAALQAQNDDLRRQVDELTAARQAAAQAAQHAAHAAYAEKLAESARVPASAVPLIAALRDALRPLDGAPVEFAEGDNSRPLDEALCGFLESLPPRVKFGEVATRAAAVEHELNTYAENADPERVALDRRIRAHMHTHSVDYSTAARAVTTK